MPRSHGVTPSPEPQEGDRPAPAYPQLLFQGQEVSRVLSRQLAVPEVEGGGHLVVSGATLAPTLRRPDGVGTESWVFTPVSFL